jgi:hypothetical protein
MLAQPLTSNMVPFAGDNTNPTPHKRTRHRAATRSDVDD